MSKIRVYVAGPMSGLPENNYPTFERVAKLVRAQLNDDSALISPHELFDENLLDRGTRPWSEYMTAGIEALVKCDAILLLPGWWKSRGTMAELNAATACGLEVWLWDDWTSTIVVA